jgi:hypothetical protein
MAVAPWIVSEESWELIEPRLPKKERRFRYPDCRRFDDRLALQGDPSTSGRGRGCGSGCMRSCSRVCGPRVSSSGR